MHCKKNLLLIASLILFSFCSWPLSAQSGSTLDLKKLSFNEMSQKVREKYAKNKATQFDNFHEQYIFVRSIGFPNTRENIAGINLDEGYINNPQFLADYTNNIAKIAEERGRNPAVASNGIGEFSLTVSPQVKAAGVKLHQFTKNGYYHFFKEELLSNIQKDQVSTVNICIDMDLRKLGFTTGWVEGQSFEKELKLRHQNMTSAIESNFPVQSYFNLTFEEYCDVRLDVTLDALEYIHKADFINVILHPDIYSNTSMYFKAH